MLPTFRSLIRGRLKVLGWKQHQLAARLGITDETVSRIMVGKQPVPVDRADDWAAALEYPAGDDREQFIDLLHLTASTPRARALYERESQRAVLAEMFKVECQNRIRRARQILDLMDPDGRLAALAGPDTTSPLEAHRVAEAGGDAADEDDDNSDEGEGE